MTRESDLLDKCEITELAQFERNARDTRNWEGLLNSYHGESRVYLSWFDGNVAEFVKASQRMAEEPGGEAIHTLGPTLVTLNGDRAIADTGCAILMRRVFAGVECDLTGYCRHRSRVERIGGVWKIHTLVGVYQKNTLAPVVPGTFPLLDTDKLKTFRASYAFQCYYRSQQGHAPFPDRPGIDRQDLIDTLVASDARWLDSGSDPLGLGIA